MSLRLQWAALTLQRRRLVVIELICTCDVSMSAGHSARHAPCELSLRPVRSREEAQETRLLAIVPIVWQRQGGHAGQALDTVSATELLAEILRPILHNYRASARSTCITVRLSTRTR